MRLPPFLNSIRWRLLVWVGFLLVLALGGFGLSAYQLHRKNQLDQIDSQLEQRLSYLSTEVRRPPDRDRGDGPRGFGGPGGPRRGPPGFEDQWSFPDAKQPAGRDGKPGPGGPPGFGGAPPAFHPIRGPHDHGPFENRKIELSGESLRLFDETDTNSFYLAIWSRGGTLLKSTTNGAPNLAMPPSPGRSTAVQIRTREGYREAYHFTERSDCVLAGISLYNYTREINRFVRSLGAAGLAVLAIGLGGAWWLASRAIQPLDQISATANRIAAGNLSERIAAGDTVNELGRLVGVLNSTFARLETAFEQQKQFTADASHELRTPLAVIISESQIALNRERSSAEYREALKVSHDAAQQMRGLTDSLLQLARFDAAQQQPAQSQTVDLAQLAHETADLLLPLAREKHVTIERHCQPASVSGNPMQLAQVISNLLQNAIFYNTPGGQVTITTTQHEASSVLTVQDTGIGISTEDLPHIFERFYRADKARARASGHTGLGLAIVKSITEKHSGKIEVKSSPAAGSTFIVTFASPS